MEGENQRTREKRTIKTKSYFSKFILVTASIPSTATSVVHPNTCKNLILMFLLTASSSTNRTRGGAAQALCDDKVELDEEEAGLDKEVKLDVDDAVGMKDEDLVDFGIEVSTTGLPSVLPIGLGTKPPLPSCTASSSSSSSELSLLRPRLLPLLVSHRTMSLTCAAIGG